MSPVQATLEIIELIGEAIREAGEIPSGHLYAQLMAYMTLEQYLGIIGLLEQSGKVKVENHLISSLS